MQGPCQVDTSLLQSTKDDEYQWMEHVRVVSESDNSGDRETYHGQLTMQADNQVHRFQGPHYLHCCLCFMRRQSLFAMIQHSMDMLQQATHALNPGQIPVIAFDQPLYALAKQIQWDKEDVYGKRIL